ncbi:UDP-N-acetylmuramoyl-tripeptide--D-alanyl-D-alanine ligase [Neisseriaceae bacterium TC5R-5]|nr:UDP-N-acetylmuramoyl-tripeptide--D-alanyl-D-alanine ligase [Neisseriaceae bacterium TC5R-5]
MISLQQAASFAQGTLHGPDGMALRVITDSRQARPGDLFIAIKGERFDAHDFVAEVCAKGAFALVERNFELANSSLIKVDNTLSALGLLAAGWCASQNVQRIGITGSNGKTTVKEMLAAILRSHAGEQAVLATLGNLNNEIGVPLTLLQLRAHHRYAVIEMGMNHPGELRYLSNLVKPQIALVNNAMRAHYGYFGSLQEVARAKAEIFSGLTHDGIAILNADDSQLDLFHAATRAHQTLHFGLTSNADVTAADIKLGMLDSQFLLHSPQGQQLIRLPLPGIHNVKNALAAASIALSLALPLSSISAGLSDFSTAKGRLQQKHSPRGLNVIDDSYNANPDSMKAALDVLAGQVAPRCFVMGDIGELGNTAAELHAEVGAYARTCGIEQVLTLGELSRHAADAYGVGARSFDSIDELYRFLDDSLPSGASVLVKGSRYMAMERVVEHLMQATKEEI